jgi:hypothetical protein
LRPPGVSDAEVVQIGYTVFPSHPKNKQATDRLDGAPGQAVNLTTALR